MKTTILFGGSGFLGDVLLRENPDVISVGRTKPSSDIKNGHVQMDSIDDLSILDDLEIDNVIFFIGNSNHHLLNNSCMDGIEYNVLPLKKALNYFQHRKINKFVCLTSILLYGNEPKGRPVNESDDVHPFTNEYIFSKFLAEQVVGYYLHKGMNIINIRISNIYGATTLMRPDLVPMLMYDALTKENPTVWNTLPERDFVFASDAADAIIKLMKTDFTGVLNLGSGKMHSVGDVVKIVEELSGKKIESLNKPVTGVMKFVTDISLINKLTGWTPTHTLKEGLEKTFTTMKNNLKQKN